MKRLLVAFTMLVLMAQGAYTGEDAVSSGTDKVGCIWVR
jgi:hypothetical protein